MQNEILLNASKVSLSLRTENGHRAVLHDVDLDLLAGESLALLGPNGSGKSVLLKVLAGLLPPDKGEITLLGRPLYPIPAGSRPQLARQLGIAFQKGGLIEALSVFENLALPLREVLGLRGEALQKRVESALEEVGLSGTMKLFPAELSGGMQKRLGVARAFLLSQKLVLLDDPTAGLDPVTSLQILKLVDELKKEHRLSLILVGSDPDEILPLCDRIAYLEEGEVRALGPVSVVLAEARGSQRAFFSREEQRGERE